MQYKYIGEGEVHIPAERVTLKPGDIVTVENEIHNDDFVLVPEEKEVATVKNKKQK